jgi:hypothetical protein
MWFFAAWPAFQMQRLQFEFDFLSSLLSFRYTVGGWICPFARARCTLADIGQICQTGYASAVATDQHAVNYRVLRKYLSPSRRSFADLRLLQFRHSCKKQQA